MEQQDSLFSRCFASEAPQSTLTLLAGIMAPCELSDDSLARTAEVFFLSVSYACLTFEEEDLHFMYPQLLHWMYSQCGDVVAKKIRMLEEAYSNGTISNLCDVFRGQPMTNGEMLFAIQACEIARLWAGGAEAAAELVAFIADPQPEMAFFAILPVEKALMFPDLAEALLAAGLAPALVKAIGHAKSSCQVMAMVTACLGASYAPEILQELRQAGLARALMQVVRGGVSKEVEPAGALVTLACAASRFIAGVISNPHAVACAAAVELIAVAPDFALEVAECLVSNEGPAAIFEQAARLNEDPHPPAHLVSSILGALPDGAVKNALIAHMLGGVRKDDIIEVFRGLMWPRPGVTLMTRNALLEFGNLFDHLQCTWCGRWSPESAATVGRSLVRFIQETPYVGSAKDDPPVDVAVRILSKLLARHTQGRYNLMYRSVCILAPRMLLGNLASVMACHDAALALRASSLALDWVRYEKAGYVLYAEEQQDLMRAVAEAGFIPHLFRLLQMPPSAWALAESPDSPPLDAASLAAAVLQEGVIELLLQKDFSYVEGAVRHGLLVVIKAAMCGSNPSWLTFGASSIRLLLAWGTRMFPLLRDAGMWPGAVVEAVERVDGSDPETVKTAALLAYHLMFKSKWAKALGELLAAGFLTKLRAALARVSSGPEVTGEHVRRVVGRYIWALETWAEVNWQSIAQLMPLTTGTAPGSSRKSNKGLKKLVLKQVLEPEEAGALAVVNPRPRGPRPQSPQSVTTTPLGNCSAIARVPMGTARQGSPGQASTHSAPSPKPSRESGGHDASVADQPIADGVRELQPHEDRERENGLCEEVPHTERQGVLTAPDPEHNKAANTCVQCGEAKKLLECAGCRSVRYCGRKCQRGHWRVHKPACKYLVHPQDEPD